MKCSNLLIYMEAASKMFTLLIDCLGSYIFDIVRRIQVLWDNHEYKRCRV